MRGIAVFKTVFAARVRMAGLSGGGCALLRHLLKGLYIYMKIARI